MINNDVQLISSDEFEKVRSTNSNDERSFFVEINGEGMNSWEDYISVIQDEFKFPESCLDSIDAYLDWMRDLEWLDKDKFILIIKNFEDFCKNNIQLKNEIISDYKEIIIPFWQEEVKNVIVDGVAKSFEIYLVE